MFANTKYAVKVAEQFAAQQRAKELVRDGRSDIAVINKTGPASKRGARNNGRRGRGFMQKSFSMRSISCSTTISTNSASTWSAENSLSKGISNRSSHSQGSGMRHGIGIEFETGNDAGHGHALGTKRGRRTLLTDTPQRSFDDDEEVEEGDDSQLSGAHTTHGSKPTASITVSETARSEDTPITSLEHSATGLWPRRTSALSPPPMRPANAQQRKQQRVDVALSKIEDAVEQQEAQQTKIASCIDSHVKLAKCRYDHSTGNTVAACCNAHIIRELQRDYKLIDRVLDGLAQLEINLAQGFVNTKLMEASIAEIVNMKPNMKPLEPVCDEDWIQLLLSSDSLVPQRSKTSARRRSGGFDHDAGSSAYSSYTNATNRSKGTSSTASSHRGSGAESGVVAKTVDVVVPLKQ